MKVALHSLSLLLLFAADLLPLQAGAQCGYTFDERIGVFGTLASDTDWVNMGNAVMLYPANNASQATAPIPMGFTFRYFGEGFDFVTVTAAAKICFDGYAPGVEEMCIGAFIDSLALAGGGYLLHKTVGSPGARKFVMELHSQACTTRYGSIPSLCWQVHLCEADMSVRILLYGMGNSYVTINPIQLSGRRGDCLFVYSNLSRCSSEPIGEVDYWPYQYEKKTSVLFRT